MRHAVRILLAASFTVLLGAAPDVAAQTVAPQAVQADAEPASSASLSLKALVEDAIDDFRRIPSLDNAGILAAGGVGAAIGHGTDRRLSRAMFASERLDTVLQPGETIGGARTQLAAAVATYTIGRVAGHGATARIGADLIRAQIVTQGVTAAIKMSVGRTRPDGTHYSFPSGHASVTFATATVLQRHLGWKIGVPAYGLATYVAASRIQDKRHFLSDVTFGAALGIVAGRTVTIGRDRAMFAVSPAPVPGGGAVTFAWVARR